MIIEILSFLSEISIPAIAFYWRNDIHNLDLLAELSFVTLTIHLCNGLNDKNLVKTEENVFSYCLTVSCAT